MSERASSSPISRRHALGGAAGVGLGLPLLAACGGDDGGTTASEPEAAPGESLTTTAEVPVGSGVILEDAKVVVTQPTEGEFVGFGIACTHQGCAVQEISPDGIGCPCHGSVFDVGTGEPTKGPASSPLSRVELVVEGDEITLA